MSSVGPSLLHSFFVAGPNNYPSAHDWAARMWWFCWRSAPCEAGKDGGDGRDYSAARGVFSFDVPGVHFNFCTELLIFSVTDVRHVPGNVNQLALGLISVTSNGDALLHFKLQNLPKKFGDLWPQNRPKIQKENLTFCWGFP